jgi:hypothetical protein
MPGMNMNMQTDTYLIGDTMYVQYLGNWMQSDLEESMWQSTDYLAQATTLLETATIERLPDEGNYYVILIRPDVQALVEMMTSQPGAELPEELNEGLEDYTYTIWVDKDSFVIEQGRAVLKLSMEMEEGIMEMDLTAD